MFIHNKYYNWYYNIINASRAREKCFSYTEKHHVIPKCLGGTNDKSNIAVLTAREHFVCHLLLVKMTTGKMHYQMKNAVSKFMQSSPTQHRSLTSTQYEKCRVYAAETARYFNLGRARSLASIQKAINTNKIKYGAGSSRIHAIISDEQKQKMIDARASRNTYDTWFVNADPLVKRKNHSKWAKENSSFVINNPSLTETGKRAISVAKSPGIIVTPYGNFLCRYDFEEHPVCKLIGFDTVYYMCNKLDNIIKTRAINRANLPIKWKNKTWRQVGFDLIKNE